MGARGLVFIYYCPDKSPPQMRMVYSTSKTAVRASLTRPPVSHPLLCVAEQGGLVGAAHHWPGAAEDRDKRQGGAQRGVPSVFFDRGSHKPIQQRQLTAGSHSRKCWRLAEGSGHGGMFRFRSALSQWNVPFSFHFLVQGHPVYTMGAPRVNAGGKSKRIVIPPPVAY